MKRRLTARAGFSLVEVIVAMTLLVTVLSALGTLSWRVTKRGQDNELVSQRTFALQHEANRYGAMSFTELVAQSNGSESIVLGDYVFTRTLTITAIGTNRYTVKVVLEPEISPAKKDSISFDRTKPTAATPVCTSC